MACLTLKPREPLAELSENPAPPRALGLKPQLELGGVLEREALHELTPVELQTHSQPVDEFTTPHGVCAPHSWRGGFTSCQRNCGFELLQIELDPSRSYSQKGAIDDEEASSYFMGVSGGAVLSERLPELGEGAAQVRPGVPLVTLWPQKLGELPPRVPPPLGGQVAQQRNCLLCPEPERPSFNACLGRPKQPDTQRLIF